MRRRRSSSGAVLENLILPHPTPLPPRPAFSISLHLLAQSLRTEDPSRLDF